MENKPKLGRKPKNTRNKIIVALREIAEVTNDPTFSFRNIGEAMNMQHPTVVEIYQNNKDSFSIKKYLKKPDEKGE